jgi:hypothetical protein
MAATKATSAASALATGAAVGAATVIGTRRPGRQRLSVRWGRRRSRGDRPRRDRQRRVTRRADDLDLRAETDDLDDGGWRLADIGDPTWERRSDC